MQDSQGNFAFNFRQINPEMCSTVNLQVNAISYCILQIHISTFIIEILIIHAVNTRILNNDSFLTTIDMQKTLVYKIHQNR